MHVIQPMEVGPHTPNETENPHARPIVGLLLVLLLLVIAGWLIAQMVAH